MLPPGFCALPSAPHAQEQQRASPVANTCWIGHNVLNVPVGAVFRVVRLPAPEQPSIVDGEAFDSIGCTRGLGRSHPHLYCVLTPGQRQRANKIPLRAPEEACEIPAADISISKYRFQAASLQHSHLRVYEAGSSTCGTGSVELPRASTTSRPAAVRALPWPAWHHHLH